MSRFLSEEEINLLLEEPNDNSFDDNDSDIGSDATENSEHDSHPEIELDSDDLRSDSEDLDELLMDLNSSSSQCQTQQSSKTSQLSTQLKTRAENIIRFTPGPKTNARDCDTISNTFRQFMDHRMLRLIVEKTNQKITSSQTNNPGHKTQSYNKLIDEREMLAYVSLCYLIGVTKSSHENVLDLWDNYGRGRDIFRAVMPTRRFQFITQNLCFDHKISREVRKAARDKLALFSEILKIFRENCRKNDELSAYVTIDEILRGFRGKCGFKQFMPNKPSKYGLKFFILADAKTSYCFDAIFYTGKAANQPKAINLGQKFVLELSKPLFNTGINITMDNWFTSFPLVRELLLNNLTVIVTIKHNKREIPKEMLERPNKKNSKEVLNLYMLNKFKLIRLSLRLGPVFSNTSTMKS